MILFRPVTMEDSLCQHHLQIHLLVTNRSIRLPSVRHRIRHPVINHSINLLSVHLLIHLPVTNLLTSHLLTRHQIHLPVTNLSTSLPSVHLLILHQVTNLSTSLPSIRHQIHSPVINRHLSVLHSNLIRQQLRNHPHLLKILTDRPAHQLVRLSIPTENL